MKKNIVASLTLILGLAVASFAQNPTTSTAATTTPAKTEKHVKMKEKAATDATAKPVVTPKGVKKHHKKHKKSAKKAS